MEAFPIAEKQIQLLAEVEGQCRVQGVLVTELLVVVVAQTQFGGEAIALVAVLGEGSLVPALGFAEGGAAGQSILVPVGTQQ
ncbi:hypothetical protein D9M68_983820 [compost metagenome]